MWEKSERCNAAPKHRISSMDSSLEFLVHNTLTRISGNDTVMGLDGMRGLALVGYRTQSAVFFVTTIPRS